MMSRSANLQINIEKNLSSRSLSNTTRLLDAPLKAAHSIVEEHAANDSDTPRITDTPVRTLLDDAPAVLFVASREGVVQYCNNFLLSYSGLSPATTARTAVIDLIHPRDRRLVAAASARAAQALAAFSVRCRLRGQSGEYKRFLVRVVPVVRGNTTWWCGVGTEAEEQQSASKVASQSHEEFKTIFASINDCYIALDRQLRVTALNQTAEAWLGMTSASLIGQNIRSIGQMASLVADSAQAQLSTMKDLQKMLEDALKHGIRGRQQIHSSLFPERWVDVQIIPSKDGPIILFRDITSQKSDQQRLTRSLGMLQSSLDALPGRIAILNASGVIIAVNKAWRVFQQQRDGATGEAVVGASYWAHCEAEEVRDGLTAALGGQSSFKTSYNLNRSTGRHCYQVAITTFEQSEFRRFVVSHEDVTELVNSKQSVADLHSRLSCLQADERQRIAIELHDSTAQYLVAAGLNLSRLKDCPVEAKARAICDEVDGLLDEALKELRTFTYLLHPFGLSDKGLVVTLHRFALGLEKRSSLQIELSLDEEIDHLPFEFQRTVLRIAQEALANAHRHAAATRVDLKIDIDGDHLHLRVSDNGRGMPQHPGDNGSPPGVGIAGMKARVAQFGGTIDFPSGPNGTTVIATIALPDRIGLVPAPCLQMDAVRRRPAVTIEKSGHSRPSQPRR